MIVAIPKYDLVFCTVTVQGGNLAHHFVGFFVGLRPGVGVIDPPHSRHFLDQLLGEKGTRYITDRIGEKTHFEKLIMDCFGHAFPAVANVDRPQATGGGIKVLFSFGIPDAHTLAFNHDHRVRILERPMLNQVVPDVIPVVTDDFSVVDSIHVTFHAHLRSGRIQNWLKIILSPPESTSRKPTLPTF